MKSPDQIPGLVGWWHAGAVTTSGSTITAAQDQSGLGRDLIGSGSPQLSGGAMVFDSGTSDFLYRADALGFSGNPAMTIVMRAGNADASKRIFQLGANSSSSSVALRFQADFSTRYQNGSKQWTNDPIPASGYATHLIAIPAGGTYDAPSLYVDGSLATPTSAGSSNTVTLANESLILGATGNYSAPNFFGNVSYKEVAVFAGVLDATQIAQISDYFSAEIFGSMPLRGRPRLSGLRGLRGRPNLDSVGR